MLVLGGVNILIYVVVSNICYFHPITLGNDPI